MLNPGRHGTPDPSGVYRVVSVKLDGYEVIGEIGRGSAGIVWLAREQSLHRLVAVKQLVSVAGLHASARFRREARSLARLDHPGIVMIFRAVTEGTQPYLVIEYVPGPTLRQLLDGGGLSAPQALGVVEQLAASVGYAAGRGVLHRDLKPSNVLFTRDGRCKVTDFGIAKLTTGSATESGFATQAGVVIGTVSYMSPEQASGTAKVDRRSDVYSLAVMTYELLVGRVPFPVAPEQPLETLTDHLHTPVPAPGDLREGFPPEVAAVLLAGLAKNPKRRCRDAPTFWQRLEVAANEAWPQWRDRASLAERASTAPVEQVPRVRVRPPGSPEGTTTVGDTETIEAPAQPGSEPSEKSPPPRLSDEPDRAPIAPLRPVRSRVRLPRSRARTKSVVVIVVGVVIAALTVWATSRPGANSAFAVTTVRLSVDPVQIPCQEATIRITALVRTNGHAGEFKYRWITPDGRRTRARVQRVTAGQQARERLDVGYSGPTPPRRTATFEVLRPRGAGSESVTLNSVCPR